MRLQRGENNLKISDEITFLKFYLQHSKAEQKGETIVKEYHQSSTSINPVDIMLDYLRVRRSVHGNF